MEDGERIQFLVVILVLLVIVLLWCWSSRKQKKVVIVKNQPKEGFINGYVARNLYGEYDPLVGSKVPTGLVFFDDKKKVESMHELDNSSTYNRFKVDQKNKINPHLKWESDATVGLSELEPKSSMKDVANSNASVKSDVVTPLPHGTAQKMNPSLSGDILGLSDYSFNYVPNKLISI
jgi:hypothetical protein